jgi:hydrogenase expression/formation protein HypC
MCRAIPGRILSVSGDDPIHRIGRVDFGGVSKEINPAYTPEARIDDYVLVHVGFALTVISEIEAQRTLAYLREMAALDSAQRKATP